jgi:hypothetical protein
MYKSLLTYAPIKKTAISFLLSVANEGRSTVDNNKQQEIQIHPISVVHSTLEFSLFLFTGSATNHSINFV